MSAQGRSRRTVWIAGAVALVVAAGATGLATQAAADPTLPPLTAEELLTKVAQARPDGLSATFEQRSDLGLPTLPTSGTDDLQDALALLSGDHTVRVWLAGEEQAKAALVDGSSESAVIRNGDDVWTWSSSEQKATHTVLSKEAKPTPSAAPTSPAEAIRKLLDAVEPTTDVATSGTGYVAGRAVYQLVLTPKDDASLVGQVRVSVDAETFVPLGARVVADDGSDALSVAATSVDFARPDAGVFAFTPPPGVTVEEVQAPTHEPRSTPSAKPEAKVTGEGWTAVAVTTMAKDAKADETLAGVLEALPEVSGAWGKGRLLSTALVNAVITDDGRVAVGSVEPERLYAALAAR